MAEEKIKILLTGAKGQLGRSFLKHFTPIKKYQILATDIEELDITDIDEIKELFLTFNPQFCVNAAAYTHVDNAEKEEEKAYLINSTATANLAEVCAENDCLLIHFSTDYVYHSQEIVYMSEDDDLKPKSVYAKSKLAGEEQLEKFFKKFVILRISWLYSEYGHNFVKTMLKLGKEKPEISVVNDQLGAPTYAGDVVHALDRMIDRIYEEPENESLYGVFNYSNLGECSWYDISQKIMSEMNFSTIVHPIPSNEYPSPAPRPLNSRLDKSKIISTYRLDIPQWESSLKICLKLLSK